MDNTILLFDVDGTLMPSRQVISDEMWAFLKDLKSKGIKLAIVGGSDFSKILEQLGGNKAELFETFEYIFSENGLVGFKNGVELPTQSINKALGEEKIQDLINFCLHYFSTIRLPVKRGNFVEFRRGMINVSPIGRSCSQMERDEFVKYEEEGNPIRKDFVKALREKFASYGLTFSIGGQISVDIFPNGWDKTFCLQYLQRDFQTIHFFGDKTFPGGNDYEIFEHPLTIGHSVLNAQETRKEVEKVLKL